MVLTATLRTTGFHEASSPRAPRLRICRLLLNTLTGKKPSKWTVTLMSLYLQRLASDDDVLRDLNKPDNTGIKLRAKDELWKKLGVQ